MAEKTRIQNSNSRPNSSRISKTRKGSASNSLSASKSSGQKGLLSREEEYKKLNEELEKKTLSLVKEAEAVINQQESLLRSSGEHGSKSLLNNISTDDLFENWGGEDIGRSSIHKKPGLPPYSKVPSASSHRPPKPSSGVTRSKSSVVASANDVLTEINNLDLQSAIDEMESKMSTTESMNLPDDILPSAAQEMGSDAQIRFLKAKARVMQEEMERLSDELALEKEENKNLSIKIKELEDERNKLARTNANQLTSLDKLKKSSNEERTKSEYLETQISALKKELDELKRSQKQQHATQSAVDVRLNRALEDVEKYKLQLNKAKEQNRAATEGDKQKIDRLMTENRKLDKQKNELMSGFKKQLKLIDILKRQKMHMEAARMLSFTEEEFVKALEWGN